MNKRSAIRLCFYSLPMGISGMNKPPEETKKVNDTVKETVLELDLEYALPIFDPRARHLATPPPGPSNSPR